MIETTIFHISDTHLGNRQYDSDLRADDFAESFDVAVEMAIENDADAVIHTGDFFDNRQPNSRAISHAFNILKKLDSEGIPFLAIVGNHERKWSDQWVDVFTRLDSVHRLNTDPFYVNNVAIYGFDSFREMEWRNTDFNVEPSKEDSINLLCMHELFQELIPLTVDRKVETVIDNINIELDAIALGDYHSAVEKIINDVPIFYAGATERTSSQTGKPTIRKLKFNDLELVEQPIIPIKGQREFVPRPFYKLQIELEKNTVRSDIKTRVESEIYEHIEESIVSVQLTGDKKSDISVKDVYSVLDKLNVAVSNVTDKRRPEIFNLENQNATDIDSVDIESEIDEVMKEKSNLIQKLDKDVVRDINIPKSQIRELVSEEYTGDKQ